LIKHFENKYAESHELIITIPEKYFNKLKHRHYRKVELSKFIDSNPDIPFWILKLKFLLKSFQQSNG
jgi:hypothetical protein